jgi:hypothetical protein
VCFSENAKTQKRKIAKNASETRIQPQGGGDGTEDADDGLDDNFPGFLVFHCCEWFSGLT